MNLIELSDNNKRVANWREFGYGMNSNFTLKNVVPFQGMKTVLFSASCFGETVKAEHIVNIQFNKIKYVDELPKGKERENVKSYEYKGSTYYFIKPTLEDQVMLRCSCPDMEYTFTYWNYKNKAAFGGPPKAYKRKTNRKPRNPDHLPGYCKHCSQFINYLQNEGWMQ